jgi:gluconolactonase
MRTEREIASGLQFPEGPIALPDGAVLVVEIAGQTLTRVEPDGRKQVIARTGGGPNGAALGPDGRCYICNNGGFRWHRRGDTLIPGYPPDDYDGGRIEAVDLASGAIEILYRSCDGHRLSGPNDLVFDDQGGFWFTDIGKSYKRTRDKGGVYYATADGKAIQEVIHPLEGPNGIGLSPDGRWLYVAESPTGRLWRFEVVAPGAIRKDKRGFFGEYGEVIASLPGHHMFDSLAIDIAGNICVATIPGGITVFGPDGSLVDELPLSDPLTTNICFGGPDLRTAYVTLSSTGRLIAMDWPRPGLRLNWQ